METPECVLCGIAPPVSVTPSTVSKEFVDAMNTVEGWLILWGLVPTEKPGSVCAWSGVSVTRQKLELGYVIM